MSDYFAAYTLGALFVLSMFFERGRSFWGEVVYFMTTVEARTVRSKMYLAVYRERIEADKGTITSGQFNKIMHLYDVSYFRRLAMAGRNIDSELAKHMDALEPFLDPEYFAAHYISPEERKKLGEAYEAYKEETEPEMENIKVELNSLHERVITCIESGEAYSELVEKQDALRERQSAIHTERIRMSEALV